jgi:hypothetical protein
LPPVKPTIATLAGFGVVMDTTDMTLARDTARATVPDLPLTGLLDLLAGASSATPGGGRADRSVGGIG